MNLKEILVRNNIPFNFSAVLVENSELPVTMVTIELPGCLVKSVDDEWEVFGLSCSIEQLYHSGTYQAILAEALDKLNTLAEQEGAISINYQGKEFPIKQFSA